MEHNQNSGYFPVFSPDFKADLTWWYRTEPKKGDIPHNAKESRWW
jgi:toxin YoeB